MQKMALAAASAETIDLSCLTRSPINNWQRVPAEAVIYSNLDLVDRATIPQESCAISGKRRVGAEVDVSYSRLCRPIKVEFAADAYQPPGRACRLYSLVPTPA